MFCLLPASGFAQDNRVSLGRLSFALSPKILEDGSINDFSLGFAYTEHISGEARFRYTAISDNKELEGVDDSLNAVTQNISELFLLPFQFNFVKRDALNAWAGIGAYYEREELHEKGFFNMPELELLDPPRERVNAYENDFEMHILGPLIDTGVYFKSEWFSVSLSVGVVPVFLLVSDQSMKMSPLLDPARAKYSQTTGGSPYFYANLDSVLFKYVNLVLLYSFVALNYKGIDFNDKLEWVNPAEDIVMQSLKAEGSLLVPVGGGFNLQAGYGLLFDSTKDAGVSDERVKQYFIFTVKKMGE
jgi:hypothetical protein